MAFILDKPTAFAPIPIIGPLVNAEPLVFRMPTAEYIGLAIGPASDHDVVRVRLPGVDSLLWRGVMLPLPPVAHDQGVSIEVSTVRAMPGRLQVLGLTCPEEMSAVARLRAPGTREEILTIPGEVTVCVEVPYGGRNTVNLTATQGGADFASGPPNLTIQTFGRIYRLLRLPIETMTEVAGDIVPFVDVPLNQPAWPAGEFDDTRTFSFNEEEPEFDSILYCFTNTDEPGGADIVIWTKYEARD